MFATCCDRIVYEISVPAFVWSRERGPQNCQGTGDLGEQGNYDNAGGHWKSGRGDCVLGAECSGCSLHRGRDGELWSFGRNPGNDLGKETRERRMESRNAEGGVSQGSG